jgi:DNA-directed RNA polymerase subunit RPC12/RpoP
MRGKLFTCSHCRNRTPVPERVLTPPAPPAADPRILGVEIKFPCGACESRLSIDARAAGAYVDCPRCGSEIRVPVLRGLQLPPSAKSKEMPTPAVRADDGPSLLDPEEVRFLTGTS